MSKTKKLVIVLIILVLLMALIPLFALKDASFGGSDDAGSKVIEQINGSYTPWVTPVIEKLIGKELPGEVESLFFCIQTGIGVGIMAYCFGYLVARKKYKKEE